MVTETMAAGEEFDGEVVGNKKMKLEEKKVEKQKAETEVGGGRADVTLGREANLGKRARASIRKNAQTSNYNGHNG